MTATREQLAALAESPVDAPPVPHIHMPSSPEVTGLIAEARNLADVLRLADAPAAVLTSVTAELAELRRRLEPYIADPDVYLPAEPTDIPAGGNLSMIQYELTDLAAPVRGEIHGRAVFRPAQLGSGRAAHGGLIPALFDELLGRMVGRLTPRCRTAYLKVDYRVVTPLHTEISLDGEVERIEGRKVYTYGSMRIGDAVLTEATGLFVQLRPGAP